MSLFGKHPCRHGLQVARLGWGWELGVGNACGPMAGFLTSYYPDPLSH